MRRPELMPGEGGAGRKAPPPPSLMDCSQAVPYRASLSFVMVSVWAPEGQGTWEGEDR